MQTLASKRKGPVSEEKKRRSSLSVQFAVTYPQLWLSIGWIGTSLGWQSLGGREAIHKTKAIPKSNFESAGIGTINQCSLGVPYTFELAQSTAITFHINYFCILNKIICVHFYLVQTACYLSIKGNRKMRPKLREYG